MQEKQPSFDLVLELTLSLAKRLVELSRSSTYHDMFPKELAKDYVVGEVTVATHAGLIVLCGLGLVEGAGINRIVDGVRRNIFDVNMREWNSKEWGGWPNFVRIYKEIEIRSAFKNGIPKFQSYLGEDLETNLFDAWYKNILTSEWFPVSPHEAFPIFLPFVPPADYLRCIAELEKSGYVYQQNNEYFWSQEVRIQMRSATISM